MRKIFSQRARIVVYVESEDVDRMEAQARSEGKTLIEWARKGLLESLNGKVVQRSEPVRVARRRTVSKGDSGGAGTVAAASAGEPGVSAKPSGKTCPHGTSKGHNCWQCGGLAVIPLLLLFLAMPCSAQSWVEAPKPKPAAHRFYDRWGKLELGAAVGVASADSAITCHNLANGGQEQWQPTQSCAGNVAILFGGVAAQEALAYGFHRLGWHKPERLIRFFTIQASSRAILYSARHGGI